MIYSKLISVDIVPSGFMTFFLYPIKKEREKRGSFLSFSFFGTKKTRHRHRHNGTKAKAGRQAERRVAVNDKTLNRPNLRAKFASTA